MGAKGLREALEISLERQRAILRGSIILNPVENLPFIEDLWPAASEFHGLYNTDNLRPDDHKRQTKHQFAGRDRIAYDSRRIYNAWAEALGAEDVSLRLLSGLHAHIVIFMSVTQQGDRVLLLPEIAGGHMSTKAILKRLGLDVVEMAVNMDHRCVDVGMTLEKMSGKPPDIVFVDRSEGLVYENFSDLLSAIDAPKIFDASQYLANIIAHDHQSPFEMGFDYIVATVHKNFPGPQKALIAARERTDHWKTMLSGISTYVSNMHMFSTYSAGLTLSRKAWIVDYSSRMLTNTIELDRELKALGIPTVSRPDYARPTHHIWIRAASQEQAFDWFKRLEATRIYVNFRKLPYNLGFGLRLGLSATTRLGLEPFECASLAKLVASSMDGLEVSRSRRRVRAFAEELWSRGMSM